MNSEHKMESTLDYAGIGRRHWRLVVMVVLGAMLIAVYFAYTLPPIYRASATILLEPSSISQELVESTVISYADQRIELVQRRVMETEKLEELVAEFDPYPDSTTVRSREKAQRIRWDTSIERVDPITLEPQSVSNAFSVHYHNPDPGRAAAVAGRIANMFLAYNQQMRAEAAEEARRFLLDQSEDLAAQVRDLDRRLAEFKKKHPDTLPEAQARNLAAIERTERDLEAMERQIRLAEERESLLALQLNQVSPTLVAAAGDWRTELATLKAQLAEAELRYTPDHPDVKRLKKAVETLTAKHAGRGSAAADTVVPDNPEYLRIQSELEAVRRELAALRGGAAKARTQIGEYRSHLAMTPLVEEEYVQLTRGRDLAQRQFLDIQGKLRQAELAENLETELHGERFTLIRAPNVPGEPFAPNRLGVVLIGFVLGVAFAAAGIVIREVFDSSVRSSADLSALTGLSVLGSIPVVLTESVRRRRRLMWSAVSLVYGAAIVFVGTTVIAA